MTGPSENGQWDDAASQNGVLQVTGLRTSGASRTITLSDGTSHELHRFACVGKNDFVRVRDVQGGKGLSVICKNGTCDLSSVFRSTTSIPGLGNRVQVKEIENAEELQAFEALGAYHYRSRDTFGRRAVLIARVSGPHGPRVIGYIEITNTFAGHKARNNLLDAPFKSGLIEWSQWNLEAKRRFLNTIARISRCVVHPEFRGCGIGVALCKAAAKYCADRWQLAKYKPVFLEITADMLKFVPFAERAGMTYIGTTSGNLDRLAKDQKYLQAVQQGIDAGTREPHTVFANDAKSILARQRRDVDRLKAIAEEQGTSVSEMLSQFLDAGSPGEMSPAAYQLLHEFVRFPKPTFMLGLNAEADRFLKKRLTETGIPTRPETPDFTVTPISRPIVVEGLTISFSAIVPEAKWSNALQEAFGIRLDSVVHTGVKQLDLRIDPGELLYVWGPSGSGKTGFLEALQGNLDVSDGTVSLPPDAQCGTLSIEFRARSVMNELSVDRLHESLYALGMTGLAEAHLYFKRPQLLSAGQKYRLGLAKLMSSGTNVWFIDEFCSILDDWTAALVSHNLQKYVRRYGVTAIVAGPRKEPIVRTLRPDRILELDAVGTWTLSHGNG